MIWGNVLAVGKLIKFHIQFRSVKMLIVAVAVALVNMLASTWQRKLIRARLTMSVIYQYLYMPMSMSVLHRPASWLTLAFHAGEDDHLIVVWVESFLRCLFYTYFNSGAKASRSAMMNPRRRIALERSAEVICTRTCLIPPYILDVTVSVLPGRFFLIQSSFHFVDVPFIHSSLPCY